MTAADSACRIGGMIVMPAKGRPSIARRRWLALLLFGLGIVAVWIDVHRWSESSVLRSCLQLGIAVGCFGLGVGIETAREWARKMCGTLGAVLAVYFIWFTVVHVWMDFVRHPSWGFLPVIVFWTVVFPALWTAVAIYCFLPSTRRHFAEVREAHARARAVPG